MNQQPKDKSDAMNKLLTTEAVLEWVYEQTRETYARRNYDTASRLAAGQRLLRVVEAAARHPGQEGQFDSDVDFYEYLRRLIARAKDPAP